MNPLKIDLSATLSDCIRLADMHPERIGRHDYKELIWTAELLETNWQVLSDSDFTQMIEKYKETIKQLSWDLQ